MVEGVSTLYWRLTPPLQPFGHAISRVECLATVRSGEGTSIASSEQSNLVVHEISWHRDTHKSSIHSHLWIFSALIGRLYPDNTLDITVSSFNIVLSIYFLALLPVANFDLCFLNELFYIIIIISIVFTIITMIIIIICECCWVCEGLYQTPSTESTAMTTDQSRELF